MKRRRDCHAKGVALTSRRTTPEERSAASASPTSPSLAYTSAQSMCCRQKGAHAAQHCFAIISSHP